MSDPDAGMPRINRGMVYLGACLIAGIRVARERQVNVRVVPTGKAIEEPIDLAHEIFNRVYRGSHTIGRLRSRGKSRYLYCRRGPDCLGDAGHSPI
jgi:hypothetical protein